MRRAGGDAGNWRNADSDFFTQVGRMGQRPIVATKGRYTLKRDGAILGGIGISGGSPDENQQICEGNRRDQGVRRIRSAVHPGKWAAGRGHRH